MPRRSTPQPPLRTFPAHWKGAPILVCGKCERKRKCSGHPLKLKKSLKTLAKNDSTPHPIHVIRVPCMDLCPKGAVTICTPLQLSQTPPTLTIIRTAADITRFYQQCKFHPPTL